MNIAVYEDDRELAGKLEKVIRQYTHFPTIINTADAGELLERTAKAAGPVLCFLDIVLDGETAGFNVAQRIAERNRNDLLVFMTAYPQKIIRNPFFKTKAFSVIFKSNPKLYTEVRETITLAEEVLQSRCLFVQVDKFQTLYIPYSSICYVETVKGTGKLCIHCLDGQYVIRETLSNMLSKLGPEFVRCHHSYIVHKKNVLSHNKSERTITFRNGATCPYSYLMKGGLED